MQNAMAVFYFKLETFFLGKFSPKKKKIVSLSRNWKHSSWSNLIEKIKKCSFMHKFGT